MDPTERRTRMSEEAAEWWVRLRREDELPRAEREQFVDWLRESSLHVAEMLRIAQVHGALEQFQRWAALSTSEEPSNVIALGVTAVEAKRTSESKPRARYWMALAASVAVVGFSVAWYVASGDTIRTQRGERREVMLADSSILQLGPESRLRVRFTDDRRLIDLQAGQVFFKVAHDAERPFIVDARDTTVRAVGTAFGVERRAHGTVVTVTEGKVEVAPPDSPSTSGAAPLLLVAGEQVSVSARRLANNDTPPEIRKVDTQRALAWTEGRLVFDQRTVGEVIGEFNRYNRVQLRVTDEALASRPISGVFDASDPESFIAFIATVAPVQILREADTITLATKDSANTADTSR